jgi:hypothetical protein
MKTRCTFLIFCTVLVRIAFAQDEITMKNGDLLKAEVKEVGSDEIKYLKWDNRQGPVYTIKKNEIFMIKYQSGQKDVFNESASAPPGTSGTGPATIFFFRPKKFAGGAPEIIVGTSVPDEVIVKVHNGSWYKTEYSNFGERDFVTGVYSINPELFRYKIEPGKTYYIRCTVQSGGFKMNSKLEMVDEETARQEMAELKQQTKNR